MRKIIVLSHVWSQLTQLLSVCGRADGGGYAQAAGAYNSHLSLFSVLRLDTNRLVSLRSGGKVCPEVS